MVHVAVPGFAGEAAMQQLFPRARVLPGQEQDGWMLLPSGRRSLRDLGQVI